MQWLAGEGCHFPCYSEDIGIAGDVGGNGNIKNRVAHIFHQGSSGFGIVIQDDDAGMVIGNTQLFFGTCHRVRIDAPNFRTFKRYQHLSVLVAIIYLGTFFGISDHDRFWQGTFTFIRI